MRLLLDSGADITATNIDEDTALHLAGHEAVVCVPMTLKSHCSIPAFYTPLRVAVKRR